jgi:hypothetical protein
MGRTALMQSGVENCARQIQIDGQPLVAACRSQVPRQTGSELPQPVRKTLNEIEIQAPRISASTSRILRADNPCPKRKAVDKESDAALGSPDVRIDRHARVDHFYDKACPVAGFDRFCVGVISVGDVFAGTKARANLD